MAPNDAEYEMIRQMVYERSRINLGKDKRELVAARLGKRLRALNMDSYTQYLRFLRTPAGQEEIQNLIDHISTNHTFFFREIRHFDFLRDEFIPEFIKNWFPKGHRSLRVWSAASSSGEEPYSIAICLSEALQNYPQISWEIDASDISRRILEKARDGVYDEDRVESLPIEIKRKYFQKGIGPYAGLYRVKPEIRQKIRWHHLNLFDPSWPFSQPFHVIFCRNVMIYFDRPSQEELVARLALHLHPGGVLLIGHSESLSGVRHPLKAIHPAIYRKPL